NSTSRRCTEDISNKATVAHVRTGNALADTDNVIGRSDGIAGIKPQYRIAAAGRVKSERMSAVGCVEIAGCIPLERGVTVGRVMVAHCVAQEGGKTVGRVM